MSARAWLEGAVAFFAPDVAKRRAKARRRLEGLRATAWLDDEDRPPREQRAAVPLLDEIRNRPWREPWER